MNPDGSQSIMNLSRFGRSFSILKVPYSFKLLMQELEVMNVHMRIITEDNIDQLLSMSYSDNINKLMKSDKKIVDTIGEINEIITKTLREPVQPVGYVENPVLPEPVNIETTPSEKSSPPYAVGSPAYNPDSSPPYADVSPAYNPDWSPPYADVSPAYNPTSPQYNPTSPQYNPQTPSATPPSENNQKITNSSNILEVEQPQEEKQTEENTQDKASTNDSEIRKISVQPQNEIASTNETRKFTL